jgi:hypothetical protein
MKLYVLRHVQSTLELRPMVNTALVPLLSHLILRPKQDAHCMYAQDQVVIHTARM